jgi:hypothetical protein
MHYERLIIGHDAFRRGIEAGSAAATTSQSSTVIMLW